MNTFTLEVTKLGWLRTAVPRITGALCDWPFGQTQRSDWSTGIAWQLRNVWRLSQWNTIQPANNSVYLKKLVEALAPFFIYYNVSFYIRDFFCINVNQGVTYIFRLINPVKNLYFFIVWNSQVILSTAFGFNLKLNEPFLIPQKA